MRNIEKLAIIGFGNQAKSWALNFRDSAQEFDICLRPGSQNEKLIKSLGFSHRLITENLEDIQTFILLTPDHTHLEILEKLQCKRGATIVLAHGQSLMTDSLTKQFPQLNFVLFAPKAIASELRFLYETRGKIGAVYNIDHVKDKSTALQLVQKIARNLGINLGPFACTVEEETKADLFSEQSLLCSLIPYSCLEAYNLLRAKGISKEVAYFEVWYEVKLIVDTLMNIGPEKFFKLISPNALLGSEKGRKKLITKDFKQNMQSLMNEIDNGHFFNETKQVDIEKLRDQISLFWKEQELTKVINELQG